MESDIIDYSVKEEIDKRLTKLYNSFITDSSSTLIYSKANLIFENEKLLAEIGDYRFEVDISPEVKARLMLKWMKDING